MTRSALVTIVALSLTAGDAVLTTATQEPTTRSAPPARPQGPCDIYAAAGASCAAAHSTTRALYAAYDGPLYRVLRQSDGRTLDIGVVAAVAAPVSDPGGYANAAAQDRFCANTYCWITTIYDQSPRHNDLIQAPRGGFSGPAMGGFNNLPLADMAPVTVMGHRVYGVFIAPGMGLRQNDAKGTAVDDQAEGQYWVINGHHYNSGCCFDYGNAETDSRDDGNGTMETTYYGNATAWYHGNPPGPWIMTDQENNLVGCVTTDGSKLCPELPNITWRFVTAIAKGEPHHWTSMGGDAQRGRLSVMFDGPRVDHTYDPMRKQGAILLGNGGDNSVGSQGTFYEGAMTAAGTFPSDATDQLVQANVVAARYDVTPLEVAPASATAAPPGLQTFSPGSSQQTTLTFTNTTGAPVTGVTLSLVVPRSWSAVLAGSTKTSTTMQNTVAPGERASATFTITSGSVPFNGDLVGQVSWTDQVTGRTHAETAAEKVRNTSLVTINEFRVNAGSSNATDSFIELYNSGTSAADISNWTVTQHQTQQPIFSAVTIPAGTMLAPRGFYLLGLSNSGLAVPARAGDRSIHVRSAAGMSVGDAITIDTGAGAETRTVVSVGTPAGNPTTVWQPVPDGPVLTIPAGAMSVPVTSVAGFTVGEQIGIGYGATYPAVAKAIERYEVVTITAVGKPGTQAFLGADAAIGATNIKVTSVSNISAGDQIRLDIDSVGHGIEAVTVTNVGTASSRTALASDANAGSTSVRVRSANGFAVGDKLTVGTPANREIVTVAVIGAANPAGVNVEVTPALSKAHLAREDVVAHGTGLDLAAPLKFHHAANIPFSARGTGIRFTPATAFGHSSNEPVLPLGTGITVDQPLAKAHAIDAVVRDAATVTAGYQGSPAPNQWFGGPALSPAAGSMVLRDGMGLVVDSLNYGNLVDPWAAEGYHGKSGAGESGCRVPTPAGGRGGAGGGAGAPVPPATPHRSAGRFPDGADTDSNCSDFLLQAATTTAAAVSAGAANIKVASVADFSPGQTVVIDNDSDRETGMIANVGTAGATTAIAAIGAGTLVVPVASTAGFSAGQAITIDAGGSREAAVIASIAGGPGGARITVASPLARDHPAGVEVAGTGITLAAALTRRHGVGTQIATALPTPGRPNAYARRR